jgi:hypothetical protein
MHKRWCHNHKTWTPDNWKRSRDIIRWVVFHAVPYIRKSLCLENSQGSLQSGTPNSNRETWGRGSVMIWTAILLYSVHPITTLHGRITSKEYVDILGNQVHPMIKIIFKKKTMQFSKMTMLPFTQPELFSYGFEQHNHQIWTSLNHSCQFLRLQWWTDSQLQYL